MTNEKKKSRGQISIEKLFTAEEIGIAHPEPHPDRAIRIFLDDVSYAGNEAFAPRWIVMPNAVLFHQMVRGDPNFGAIYIYERGTGDFYAVYFEGDVDHVTVRQFAELVSEYDLLQFASSPALLRGPVQPAGEA